MMERGITVWTAPLSGGVCVASEGALQQTVAATAGRTLVLPPEPVHHVTGVSSMAAA